LGGRLVIIRNVLKAWALLLGACAVLGLIGWVLGGYRLLSIFVFCGVLLASALYWYADRVAVGLVGARELPMAAGPGLHSTIERLAARAGVAKPRLYLMDDGLPRALAAGRGPRGSVLAVSSGLLTAASPAELEAVLAHELAHVRHRDVVVQTSVVVLAATVLELSRVGGWFQRVLLWFLGPLASAFVHLLLSPKREFLAAEPRRQSATRHIRWPMPRPARPGCRARFVQRQSGDRAPLHGQPFLEVGLAALFVTHPPVGERVRRLRDWIDWREKLAPMTRSLARSRRKPCFPHELLLVSPRPRALRSPRGLRRSRKPVSPPPSLIGRNCR
jgi:heat shock protein HtpX